MAKASARTKKTLAGLVIFLYVVLLYFPIYEMITMAFKNRVDITSVPPKFFFHPTLSNFQWLATNADISGPIIRSLIITVVSIGFALLFGTVAAYALARFKWWRQRDIEFWIISTRMLPPVAVIIPYYYIWLKLRMIDTVIGVTVTYLTLSLPLVIWLLLGFFRSIPKEMDDAAKVDGCTPMMSLWYIALPLARGAIGAAAVLAFIFTWNDLFFGFVLTTVNTTFPVTLSSFQAVGLEVKYGQMAAAGLIAAVPSLALAFIARRSIVEGFRGIAGIASSR